MKDNRFFPPSLTTGSNCVPNLIHNYGSFRSCGVYFSTRLVFQINMRFSLAANLTWDFQAPDFSSKCNIDRFWIPCKAEDQEGVVFAHIFNRQSQQIGWENSMAHALIGIRNSLSVSEPRHKYCSAVWLCQIYTPFVLRHKMFLSGSFQKLLYARIRQPLDFKR